MEEDKINKKENMDGFIYVVTIYHSQHNYGGSYLSIGGVFDNYGLAYQYAVRYAWKYGFTHQGLCAGLFNHEWRKYDKRGDLLEFIRVEQKMLNEERGMLEKHTIQMSEYCESLPRDKKDFISLVVRE